MIHSKLKCAGRVCSVGTRRPSAGAGIGVSLRKQVLLVIAAAICLAFSSYYVLVIVPAGTAASGRPFVADLYPAWYSSRQVLHHHSNPYSEETTRQIQLGMYGHVVAPASTLDEQRFAYPLTSVFLFAPIAVLSFPMAQAVTFLFFLAAACATLKLYLPQRMPALTKFACSLCFLASFPVLLGLQLRQPTLLIVALLSAAVACLRSRHLVAGGLLLALATAKPQLALPFVVPLLLWGISARRDHKAFIYSLLFSECTLLVASEAMVPGWIRPWISTLKAYTHYAGAQPLASHLLGNRFPLVICGVGFGMLIAVSWKWRNRDPLFAIAFSVSVCQLIFPFQLYNEIMLVLPVAWLMKGSFNVDTTAGNRLLCRCLGLFVAVSWACMVIAVALHLVHPETVTSGWTIPMIPIYLLPYAVFAAMVVALIRGVPATSGFQLPSSKKRNDLQEREENRGRRLVLGANEGQSLLETAILLPMLTLMLCFAVDTGYYMLVAANLVSASRVAVEYASQGYSSPGQLQLPGAGPIGTTTSVSALAVGDLSGLLSSNTTTTVAVCSKSVGITGNLTKCGTYGSGTQQYAPDTDPEAPMFMLQRVDVLYTVQPPIPLSFFSLNAMPPLTVHRRVEFRAVD